MVEFIVFIFLVFSFIVAVFFTVSILCLFFHGRINPVGFLNLIYGKTQDPLASRNKAGMIVRPNGNINFQSSRK